MSAKICGLVWELDLPREEKYVLLCLADHADHDGNNVFPSIGLIAWKTDYSERRIQELMRRLQHKRILVRVEEQFGRGHTMKYRIDLQAGSFRERRIKGARISPIPCLADSTKGEISQGQKGAAPRVKGATDSVKGEIATAPESLESKEPKACNQKLPLPPLSEGDVSTIWQIVCKHLKDDLSDAFVKTPHFTECAYDTYFRDAWLAEITNDVAFLDSDEPELLERGVQKFEKRLRETFCGAGSSIRLVRVRSQSSASRGDRHVCAESPRETPASGNVIPVHQ